MSSRTAPSTAGCAVEIPCSIARVESLELKDGRTIYWRREVAMRLINLQQRDGSWSNTNGRWWEKDPNLVTAYAIQSLDIIHRGIR